MPGVFVLMSGADISLVSRASERHRMRRSPRRRRSAPTRRSARCRTWSRAIPRRPERAAGSRTRTRSYRRSDGDEANWIAVPLRSLRSSAPTDQRPAAPHLAPVCANRIPCERTRAIFWKRINADFVGAMPRDVATVAGAIWLAQPSHAQSPTRQPVVASCIRRTPGAATPSDRAPQHPCNTESRSPSSQ
jgi:hypothetical protein